MLTGVILTGGQRWNIGGIHEPSFLPFYSENLIQRQVRMMEKICDEIIIVTNKPKKFLAHFDSKVRIITEFFSGKGVLGEMHAAFTLSKWPYLWVVNYDMPFVSYQAAKLLLRQKRESNYDAVIPYVTGRTHHFHGIYNKNSVDTISKLLNEGHIREHELLQSISIETLDDANFQQAGISTRFTMRIRSLEEYEEAIQLAAPQYTKRPSATQ